MSKIILLCLIILFVFPIVFLTPKTVQADGPAINCGPKYTNIISGADFPATGNDDQSVTITVTFTGQQTPGWTYKVLIPSGKAGGGGDQYSNGISTGTAGPQTFTVPPLNLSGDLQVKLIKDNGKPGELGNTDLCVLGKINLINPQLAATASCPIIMPSFINHGDSYSIQVTNVQSISQVYYFLHIKDASNNDVMTPVPIDSSNTTIPSSSFPNLDNASYTAVAEVIKSNSTKFISGTDYKSVLVNPIWDNICFSFPFTIGNGTTSQPTTAPTGNGPGGTTTILTCTGNQCTSAQGTTCTPGSNSSTTTPADPNAQGVETAIGCVPTDPATLIQKLLTFALGAAGGIALLLMAFGAIEMITSGGNAEQLKAGQGRFTSAIIGLLFVVFSVLLLKVIGVDILQIPGFG